MASVCLVGHILHMMAVFVSLLNIEYSMNLEYISFQHLLNRAWYPIFLFELLLMLRGVVCKVCRGLGNEDMGWSRLLMASIDGLVEG